MKSIAIPAPIPDFAPVPNPDCAYNLFGELVEVGLLLAVALSNLKISRSVVCHMTISGCINTDVLEDTISCEVKIPEVSSTNPVESIEMISNTFVRVKPLGTSDQQVIPDSMLLSFERLISNFFSLRPTWALGKGALGLNVSLMSYSTREYPLIKELDPKSDSARPERFIYFVPCAA